MLDITLLLAVVSCTVVSLAAHIALPSYLKLVPSCPESSPVIGWICSRL